MPTRDQLAEALRKADAAGAADDARQLAAAIRELDAKQPAGVPALPAAPPNNSYDQMAATPQRSVVGEAPQWDMQANQTNRMLALGDSPQDRAAQQMARGVANFNAKEKDASLERGFSGLGDIIAAGGTMANDWVRNAPNKGETLARLPIELTGVGTALRLENEAARRAGEEGPSYAEGFKTDENYNPAADLAGLLLNAGSWSTRSAGGGLINPRAPGQAVANAAKDVATNLTMGVSDLSVPVVKGGVKLAGALGQDAGMVGKQVARDVAGVFRQGNPTPSGLADAVNPEDLAAQAEAAWNAGRWEEATDLWQRAGVSPPQGAGAPPPGGPPPQGPQGPASFGPQAGAPNVPAAPAAPQAPPPGNLQPVQQPRPMQGPVTREYANLHPKVQAAFTRLLESSDVPAWRIPYVLRELDNLPSDRAEMVATELIKKFGSPATGEPKLQTNITAVGRDFAVNTPTGKGDKAQAVVRGNIRRSMGQESSYVEGVAERNFGPGVVASREEIDNNLRAMRGRYQKLLDPANPYGTLRSATKKAAVDQARTNLATYLKRVDTAQEIPDWLKRDTLNTLNNDLREMGLDPIERNALGQAFTWSELVDQYPTQIAHALQSTYARASREAGIAQLGDLKAGAFQRDMSELRGQSRKRANAANPADRGYGLLHLLEEAVPGYKSLREQFGTEHGLRTALNVPERFLSAAGDEVKFADFLDDLDNLTPDQRTAAENRITTMVRDAIRKKQENPTLAEVGAGENGVMTPNLERLAQGPVLHGLETAFGAKGKELADAIRLSRATTQTLGKIEPDYGPRTASNIADAGNAPKLYEDPKAIGGSVIDQTSQLLGAAGVGTALSGNLPAAIGIMSLAAAKSIWNAIKKGRKLSPEQRTQFAQFLFALRHGDADLPAIEGAPQRPQLPGPGAAEQSGFGAAGGREIASQVVPPAAMAALASVGPEDESYEDKLQRMGAAAGLTVAARNAGRLRGMMPRGAEALPETLADAEKILADPRVASQLSPEQYQPLYETISKRMQEIQSKGLDKTQQGYAEVNRLNGLLMNYFKNPDGTQNLGKTFKRAEATDPDRTMRVQAGRAVNDVEDGVVPRQSNFATKDGTTYTVHFDETPGGVDVSFNAETGPRAKSGPLVDEFKPLGNASLAEATEVFRNVEKAIKDDIATSGAERYVLQGRTSRQRELYAQMAKTKQPPDGYRWEMQERPGQRSLLTLVKQSEPPKNAGGPPVAANDTLPKGQQTPAQDLAMARAFNREPLTAERAYDFWTLLKDETDPRKIMDVLDMNLDPSILRVARGKAMVERAREEVLRRATSFMRKETERNTSNTLSRANAKLAENNRSIANEIAQLHDRGVPDQMIARSLGLEDGSLEYFLKYSDGRSKTQPKPTQNGFGGGNGTEQNGFNFRGPADAVTDAYGKAKQALFPNDPRHLNAAQEALQGLSPVERALLERNAAQAQPVAAMEAANTPASLSELVGRVVSQDGAQVSAPRDIGAALSRQLSPFRSRTTGADKPIDTAAKAHQTRLAEAIMTGQRAEPDLINMDPRSGPTGALEKNVAALDRKMQSDAWFPAREAERDQALSALMLEGEKGVGGIPESAPALDRFREGINAGAAKPGLNLSPRDEARLSELLFDPAAAKDAAQLASTPVRPWVSNAERTAIQVGVPAVGLAGIVGAGASFNPMPDAPTMATDQPSASQPQPEFTTDAVVEQLMRGLRGPTKEGMKRRTEEKYVDAARQDQMRPNASSGNIYTVPDNMVGTSNPSEPPPELNGFNTDTRTRAQQRLMALGYAPQKLKNGARFDDGVDGPQLREAVMAFQRENKLPVTGDLDPMTLRTMWGGKNYMATPVTRAYGEELAPAPQ